MKNVCENKFDYCGYNLFTFRKCVAVFYIRALYNFYRYLKCYNIYTLSKDLLAIQVECEAFLDDKQMIKFDLSEDQIMTFVCAIYKI